MEIKQNKIIIFLAHLKSVIGKKHVLWRHDVTSWRDVIIQI